MKESKEYWSGWWDAMIQTIRNTIRIYGVEKVNVAVLSDLCYDAGITDKDIDDIIAGNDLEDEVVSVIKDLKRIPE